MNDSKPFTNRLVNLHQFIYSVVKITKIPLYPRDVTSILYVLYILYYIRVYIDSSDEVLFSI